MCIRVWPGEISEDKFKHTSCVRFAAIWLNGQKVMTAKAIDFCLALLDDVLHTQWMQSVLHCEGKKPETNEANSKYIQISTAGLGQRPGRCRESLKFE